MSKDEPIDEGWRVAAVLAATLVLAGCAPTLGFYSVTAVLEITAAACLAGLAVSAPATLEGIVRSGPLRRLWPAVGPLWLLAEAARLAVTDPGQSTVVTVGPVALAGVAAALLRAPNDEETVLELLLPGLLLWAGGMALMYARLMFVSRVGPATAVGYTWAAMMLLGFALLLWRRPGTAARCVALAAFLAGGLLVRGEAIRSSPDPVIDVHAWLVQAPQALAHGRNPYAMTLDSPYGTPRALRFRVSDEPAPDPPTYPPGIILAVAPPVLLGVDPRWLFVATWLVLALLALVQAGQAGLGPWRAVLLAGLVLLPVSASFTAEQGWFDVLVGVLFVVAMLPAGRGAGVALGLCLTVKQSALFLLPAAVARWWRRPQVLAVALGVALLVSVPFVLWGPADFWRDVVSGHLMTGVRGNAICLPALLLRTWDASVPGGPLLLLAWLLAMATAWAARGSPGRLTVAAGFAMLAFNLLNRRAMYNYYEVAAALLLAGAALPDQLEEDPHEADSRDE